MLKTFAKGLTFHALRGIIYIEGKGKTLQIKIKGDIKMLTLETFGEHNRSKCIGDSLYIICQSQENSKFYIHERIANGKEFSMARGFFGDLESVIKKFNEIELPREIINKMFK